jgi:DNA-binding NarL/FixJ family response regulator
MFQKILIADDLDSINHGVAAIASRTGTPEVVQVHYCDDAYLKLKKARLDGHPFDLFICDLSFKQDHRAQQFANGDALLETVRTELPDLKVIVYSVEDRLQRVRGILKASLADAYVGKGRNGLTELARALEAVENGDTYVSPHLQQALRQPDDLELDDYDIRLLQLLAQGSSQEEISNHFKQQGISPASLSSIEKRLNKLRIQFKAQNAIHLVALVKDLGLI